eukprot:s512_g15.t1
MAPKTKKDYVAEMMALGEQPPDKWSITEIKVRIGELCEEQGITGKKNQTELQGWVVALNKASRKKSDLQKFNHEKLQLPVEENATIAQLQKSAMEKIYMISAAESTDPVGFGKHSALTYGEVQVHHPEYGQWAIQTSKEGQRNPRLMRLATWLQSQKGKPIPTPVPVAMDSKKGPGSVSEASSASTAALMGVMQQMVTQMTEMKEELEELKGARPHKKVIKDEEMDDQSSWSPLTNP